MKELVLAIMCLVLMVGVAGADMADTQGRTKVATKLNQMVDVLETAKERGGQIYSSLKTYITDNPSQFSVSDRNKLSAYQSQLTTIQNNINTFITNVESDFPGIRE